MKSLAKEWNLPENSIFVQGSSLRMSNVADIGDLDIAIKVNAATFDNLVARFKGVVSSDKVLNRIGSNGKIGGLDMFNSPNIGEKAFTVKFYEKFKQAIGQEFTQKYGVESIQISIIKEGSSIDVSPYLKLK